MPHVHRIPARTVAEADLEAFVRELQGAAKRDLALELTDVHFQSELDLSYFRTDAAIEFRRCHFDGPLKFQHARLGASLDIADCKLKQGANLAAAKIGGSVSFSEKTEVSGQINLRAKVAGQVSFSNVTINVGEERIAAVDMETAEVGGSVFFDEGTNVTGQIDLRAEVGGGAYFSNVTINAGRENLAVNLEAAHIGGALHFTNETNIIGQVDLRAKVTGQVAFSNVTICVNPGEKAVEMDAAEIGGAAFLRDGVWLEGNLSMCLATFSKGLIASHRRGRLEFFEPGCCNELPFTLTGLWDLGFSTIRGPLYVHGASIGGRVDLRHATVEGDADFCGGVLGPSDPAAASTLDGESGNAAEHRIAWNSLHDRRKLLTINGDQAGAVTPALDLRHARVGGRLWLKGQRILGHVQLEDAQIEGEANFTRGQVLGDLVLRSAKIVGRVFGDETDQTGAFPQVLGIVDAHGAQLSEVDIRFGKRSIADVLFPKEIVPTEIKLDAAEARNVRISGQLPTPPPTLSVHNLKFDDLDVSDLKEDSRATRSPRDVARALIWTILWIVSLCASNNLATRGYSWAALAAAAYGFITIAVWVVESLPTQLRGPDLVLALLPKTMFSSAFYLEVERWLRAQGHDTVADDVFLSRRRRELGETIAPSTDAGRGGDPAAPPPSLPTPAERIRCWCVRACHLLRDGRRTLAEGVAPTIANPIDDSATPKSMPPTLAVRWWRWCVLDFCLGYGVRPSRVIHLFVLLMLINWGVFLNPQSVERPLAFVMPPQDGYRQEAPEITQLEGEPNPWPSEGGLPRPDDWTAQQAFFAALRLQVPILDLIAENEWEPSDRKMHPLGLKFENYAALMQAANLVLLPLLVAGVTGFLKRKD